MAISDRIEGIINATHHGNNDGSMNASSFNPISVLDKNDEVTSSEEGWFNLANIDQQFDILFT